MGSGRASSASHQPFCGFSDKRNIGWSMVNLSAKFIMEHVYRTISLVLSEYGSNQALLSKNERAEGAR